MILFMVGQHHQLEHEKLRLSNLQKAELKNKSVAYCPERVLPGNVIDELLKTIG